MTIIDKPGADIDARFRSLLQKAVRRGNIELVYTISAMLESFGAREKHWFTNRTAVITFEECWPLGTDLVFNKRFHSKVAALVKTAGSVKTRDATGLGFLSYRLSEGDRSVLEGTPDDRHIKIVANAVRRPDDFWNWLDGHDTTREKRLLIQNAMQHRNAGRPPDNAAIQAAAYMAASGELPELGAALSRERSFPYWTALDMHTPQGKRVLTDVARDLHIPLKQVEWTMFYFEGTATNESAPAKWWERHCRWQFRKIGIAPEEAHLIWEPIKPQVLAALADESRLLHREIYSWKMANPERIESLKKQVELFLEHFDSGRIDQLELF